MLVPASEPLHSKLKYGFVFLQRYTCWYRRHTWEAQRTELRLSAFNNASDGSRREAVEGVGSVHQKIAGFHSTEPDGFGVNVKLEHHKVLTEWNEASHEAFMVSRQYERIVHILGANGS